MSEDLSPETIEQVDSAIVEASRPLIVCDADGVLVEFMPAFEAYLESRDRYFDWTSFRLVGNVRRRTDDEPVEAGEVRAILDDFYRERVEDLEPLPGAASALRALSGRARIVVLSNIPPHAREGRARCLRRHGMDYPVITNAGGKGPAVRRLSARTDAPTVFIDDIPRNHTSVARAANRVIRIHFVADRRLSELFGPSEDSHHRAADWAEARAIVERRLADRGFR